MARDVSRIREVAEPIAAERGLEILDVEIGGSASNPVVRVILDSADDQRRIGIDDCQDVSRRLGDGLDAYEVLRGRYMLEVSSPGVNKPLKRPVHFARVVGRKVRVRASTDDGAKRSWLGRLEEADDDGIVVREEGAEPVRIAFVDIEKANLEFEFEEKPAPKKTRRR